LATSPMLASIIVMLCWCSTLPTSSAKFCIVHSSIIIRHVCMYVHGYLTLTRTYSTQIYARRTSDQDDVMGRLQGNNHCRLTIETPTGSHSYRRAGTANQRDFRSHAPRM
jgi:hypothetical protein